MNIEEQNAVEYLREQVLEAIAETEPTLDKRTVVRELNRLVKEYKDGQI